MTADVINTIALIGLTIAAVLGAIATTNKNKIVKILGAITMLLALATLVAIGATAVNAAPANGQFAPPAPSSLNDILAGITIILDMVVLALFLLYMRRIVSWMQRFSTKVQYAIGILIIIIILLFAWLSYQQISQQGDEINNNQHSQQSNIVLISYGYQQPESNPLLPAASFAAILGLVLIGLSIMFRLKPRWFRTWGYISEPSVARQSRLPFWLGIVSLLMATILTILANI